ncbi:MAG TPA: DMT family transporter [Albitalea sp.]|uniref:DMT family transporter n=1 Tax=Piscinibacter sp. TaxID=1903157 RepID=UPI002ED24D30
MNTASIAAAGARPRSGAAAMAAAGLLLGTLGVFVQEAAQHPLTTVWFRCAFGAAALLAWGAASGRLRELRLDAKGWRAVVTAGVLMISSWALFFAAIERTSIGLATVVFHVQPLWLMAWGAWRLGEPVSKAGAGGAAMALAGLALASGLVDDGTSRLGAGHLAGIAMCLAASLCYTGVSLIAKTSRSASSFALAWGQCMVGVVALAWWPVAHGWPALGPAWGWLAGLGVVHTGLAYVLLYAGMSRLSSWRIAVLQFVYPATAIAMDWLVYGRALSAVQIGGVVLMALALLAAREPR